MQGKGHEKTDLPSWLVARDPVLSHSEKLAHQHHYVANTLNKIARLLETSIFSEKYASQRGLLQQVDPRVKVITLFSFLIAVNLFQHLNAILAVYSITLLLTYLSKIPLGFFLKRVWIFIPLFAGVIALPAIFNIFTPGDPIVTLARFNEVQHFWGFNYTDISITRQGVLGAILFTFRVATSVSVVVLLTLTTHWVEILKALRVLGVPQVFILVLSMTYQYVILLARLIQDMHIAKKARTIPYNKNHKKSMGLKAELAWVASRIGTTFRKSYAMIDETHNAMIARGFRGEIQIFQQFKLHWIDLAWTIGMIAVLAGIIWINFL